MLVEALRVRLARVRGEARARHPGVLSRDEVDHVKCAILCVIAVGSLNCRRVDTLARG